MRLSSRQWEVSRRDTFYFGATFLNSRCRLPMSLCTNWTVHMGMEVRGSLNDADKGNTLRLAYHQTVRTELHADLEEKHPGLLTTLLSTTPAEPITSLINPVS